MKHEITGYYYPGIELDTDKDRPLVLNFHFTSLYMAEYLGVDIFYKFQKNSTINNDLNFWLVNIEEAKSFIKKALKYNFENMINQESCKAVFGDNWQNEIYEEYNRKKALE